MNKKVIILIAILTLIVLAISQVITFNAVKSTLYDYNTKGKNQIVHDSIKNYDSIMCNYNVFRPQYAFITSVNYQYNNIDRKSLSIGFFNISRPHPFSLNWKTEYTGGTDVKNTTFDELVKMVKEDCSQFQKGHGDYYGEDLAWSYSPYTPEPEKTPEEIAEEEYERWLIDAIDEMRRESEE